MNCAKCNDRGYYFDTRISFPLPTICSCEIGSKLIEDLDFKRRLKDAGIKVPDRLNVKSDFGNLVGGHTQIIHFKDGLKRTIENVQKVWENEMVHVIDASGREWIINKDNVLAVEIINPK